MSSRLNIAAEIAKILPLVEDGLQLSCFFCGERCFAGSEHELYVITHLPHCLWIESRRFVVSHPDRMSYMFLASAHPNLGRARAVPTRGLDPECVKHDCALYRDFSDGHDSWVHIDDQTGVQRAFVIDESVYSIMNVDDAEDRDKMMAQIRAWLDIVHGETS